MLSLPRMTLIPASPSSLGRGRAKAGYGPYECKAARDGVARESIMVNPSPPILEIHGDDVTVEATYLAARLGLPVDKLLTEMQRGIVYSRVERGIGEDAGQLRLTFRYRARAWTVIVQRDGTLSEAPDPDDDR